jgi:chemotaxis protein histidine kinase CheA
MSLSDEPAPLSPWPFLIADAIALGTAFYIGSQAHTPYSGATVIGIGALVAVGAASSVLPFILNHARKQDMLLAERQREIAALAQTVSSCTEQLSIAAGSLHSIAEAAAKSVKQAEQLPNKLQEKIHEFKEQIHEVSSTENEALSQEVNALRSSETERIESVVTTVRKLSGEFARLEAASRKHVTDLSEALERFTKSAQQAASDATATIGATRVGSEKSLADAQTAAVHAIEDCVRRGLADFDQKLANFSDRLAVQFANAPRAADVVHPTSSVPAITHNTSPNVEDESPRSRAVASQAEPAAETVPVASAHAATTASRASSNASTRSSQVVSDENPATAESKASRKKSVARRADSTDEFNLGLELTEVGLNDEFSQADPDANGPAAVSHDGLTRLVVTSYIGIGNKLFIRGEGPGLSWDQGVPLQFVSIGKWRWETADADGTVRIKLYKNDEQESATLGEVTLESGHQREVKATF